MANTENQTNKLPSVESLKQEFEEFTKLEVKMNTDPNEHYVYYMKIIGLYIISKMGKCLEILRDW